MLLKIDVIKNSCPEKLKNETAKGCVGVSFLMEFQAWDKQICQKEIPVLVVSCEFYKHFQQLFLQHLRMAAFDSP